MAMNYRLYIASGGTFAELPVPSGMTQGLQDISAPNAGRTESTLMMKDRIGKAPRIEVTYQNRDTALVTSALSLVAPEYFGVIYMDLENGGGYSYGEFYRGDVTANVYNGAMDIWSSFKFAMIKRDGKAGVACNYTLQTTKTAATYSIPSATYGSTPTIAVIDRKYTLNTSFSNGTLSISAIPNDTAVDSTIIVKPTSMSDAVRIIDVRI